MAVFNILYEFEYLTKLFVFGIFIILRKIYFLRCHVPQNVFVLAALFTSKLIFEKSIWPVSLFHFITFSVSDFNSDEKSFLGSSTKFLA